MKVTFSLAAIFGIKRSKICCYKFSVSTKAAIAVIQYVVIRQFYNVNKIIDILVPRHCSVCVHSEQILVSVFLFTFVRVARV